MDSIRLIHIAPELPPTVGGVADYTCILSQRLVEMTDRAVEPILVHAGRREADSTQNDFPVVDLSGQCSAPVLKHTIERLADEAEGHAVVLLEYSGYGYAKRGAPLWLARGLRRLPKNGIPLVTMFHELYATGPPWTSAFWLSALQRFVAILLLRASCGVLTNLESSKKWLCRYTSDNSTSVQLSPVFSNVGELDRCPPFRERESYAVTFGGRRCKSFLYDRSINETIRSILSKFGIDAIWDIGPRSEAAADCVGGVSVQGTGILPVEKISSYLRQARVGMMTYPDSLLAKSGSFAAFASHGVPTIVFDEEDNHSSAGLYETDRHYIGAGAIQSLTDIEAIGRAVFAQYQQLAHSARSASRFCETLTNCLHKDDISTLS